MKNLLLILSILSIESIGFGQETYTSLKGPRIFPGHLHVAITVDSNKIHYQLFNHWYSRSYSQYRDLEIPLNELEEFNNQNDTLQLIISNKKISLIDKKYKLRRNVKHRELCNSSSLMRKISFADKLASQYDNIIHFHLYKDTDLELPEKDFRIIVEQKLLELLGK